MIVTEPFCANPKCDLHQLRDEQANQKGFVQYVHVSPFGKRSPRRIRRIAAVENEKTFGVYSVKRIHVCEVCWYAIETMNNAG